MIAIHPVHLRLAELVFKAKRLNGFENLTQLEQQELDHCLQVNAKLVWELEILKDLSFQAYQLGDVEWQQDICLKIDEIESKCIL